MDGLKPALVGQYRAGLAELRDAVCACPDSLWTGGEHPRTTWRIAYHALFFTDLYLHQGVDGFKEWSKHRGDKVIDLWGEVDVCEPYTKEEVCEYLDELVGRLPELVEAVDLAAGENGFPWYGKAGMNKLDHYLMNLRHLQEHVGQVRDRLYSAGGDTDWIGKR